MSPLSTLGPEGRTVGRGRDHGSICTQGAKEAVAPARAGAVPAGGRLTLEQLLDSVWEGLRAGGTAECPVCDGPMQRTGPGGARCGRCGTTMD